jgi:hypothetical protein
MNYARIYDILINSAKQRESVIGYTEMHHIKPLCLGGSNKNENLVRLTAKEHYVAHHLLWKIHKSGKLAHAWFCMVGRIGDNQDRFITATHYNNARLAHVNHMKEAMQGAGNHFYGKKHTQETKDKISKANTGNKRPQKEIDRFQEWAKLPRSEEHKSKIGRKGLAMLQNIHTLEIIRDFPEDYDPEIWVNPKKITPDKQYKCEHCSMITSNSNIKRWHNDKCKHKKV